jgi:hypothetical protein
MLKEHTAKDDDILKQQKRVVEDIITVRMITEENSVFSRTEGGFVSLKYTKDDGEIKVYNRVSIHRCFPYSDPDRYISIREPDRDGREIGLIEDLNKLSSETRAMIEEQLELRYFAPIITKIRHIREEYGYSYWDVVTDKGPCRFTVRMGGSNVYSIGVNRYLVNDLDGNRFEIPDLYKMSAREIKLLDLFI